MLTEEKYVRWNSGTSAWDVMYWARYRYDTAGNMTYREVDQIVNSNVKQYVDGPFTYSRGYQLTGFTRKGDFGAETRTFTLTYDANGNMTHIEQSATFTDSFYDITEMEFQFDEKNRMTQYRFGGAGSWHQIKYDALGRVRERVDLTPTTTKYYSDGRQLIQQLDDSDNVEFDYFRGPTGLMRQLEEGDPDKKRFYIKDPLGTIWALVDPSSLSVTRYNYNAWGGHLDKDDTDFPTDTNWMRYIGCRVESFGKGTTTQTDAIYHLDHRHYLPVLGIFSQRDPLSIFHKTLNLPYSYSMSSPSNRHDPLGLKCGSTTSNTQTQPLLCDFNEYRPECLNWLNHWSIPEAWKTAYAEQDWYTFCCTYAAWVWLGQIFYYGPKNCREDCCFHYGNEPNVEFSGIGATDAQSQAWSRAFKNKVCEKVKRCLCLLNKTDFSEREYQSQIKDETVKGSSIIDCFIGLCDGSYTLKVHFISMDEVNKYCGHLVPEGMMTVGCGDCETCTIYIVRERWETMNIRDRAEFLIHEFIHACSCAEHPDYDSGYSDPMMDIDSLCGTSILYPFSPSG